MSFLLSTPSKIIPSQYKSAACRRQTTLIPPNCARLEQPTCIHFDGAECHDTDNDGGGGDELLLLPVLLPAGWCVVTRDCTTHYLVPRRCLMLFSASLPRRVAQRALVSQYANSDRLPCAPQVVVRGWLDKCGMRESGEPRVQRRWFVLDPDAFSVLYYRSPDFERSGNAKGECVSVWRRRRRMRRRWLTGLWTCRRAALAAYLMCRAAAARAHVRLRCILFV